MCCIMALTEVNAQTPVLNQMISYTQATTANFRLNPNRTHVYSNRLMTKADILDIYNVRESLMNSYTDKQLVPFGAINNNTMSYKIYISSGAYFSSAVACTVSQEGEFPLIAVYTASSNSIAKNNRVYKDEDLTQPFVSTDTSRPYIIRYNQNSQKYYTTISSNGTLGDIYNCN